MLERARRLQVLAAAGAVAVLAAAPALARDIWRNDVDAANHTLIGLPAPGGVGNAALRLQDAAVCAGIPKWDGVNGTASCAAGGVDFENPLSVTAPVHRAGNTLSIDANGITNSFLRQGAPFSVIGVAGSGTANVADIAASGASQFLGTNAAGTALAFTSSIPLTSLGTTSVANVTALEALAGSGYRDGSVVYVSSVAADFVLHASSSVTVDHITIASVSGSSGARWIRKPTPDGYWFQTGTQFYLGGAGASDENNCTAAITPCATAGELRRRLLGRIMPAGATQSFTYNVDASFSGGDFDPISVTFDPTRNAGTTITVVGVPTVTAIGTISAATAHNYAGNQSAEIVVSGWTPTVGKIIRKVGTTGTGSVTAVVLANLGSGRARITPSSQFTIGAADLTTGDVIEELTTLPKVAGLQIRGLGAMVATLLNYDPATIGPGFEANQGGTIFVISSYVKGAAAWAANDASGRGIGFTGCSVTVGGNARGSFSANASAFIAANVNVANSVVGRNEWQDSVFVNATLTIAEYVHIRFHSLGFYGLGAGAVGLKMLDGASVSFTDAAYGTGNDAGSFLFSFVSRNSAYMFGFPVDVGNLATVISVPSTTIPTSAYPYYPDTLGNLIMQAPNVDPLKNLAAISNTGGIANTQVAFADSTKTIRGSANFIYSNGTPSTIARLTIGDHVNATSGRITLDSIDAGASSSATGMFMAQGGTTFVSYSASRNSTATTGKVTAQISLTPVSGGSQQDSFSIAGNTNPAGSIVVYPHTNYGDVILGGNNGGDEMPSTATTGWVWIPRVNGAPTNTPTLDGVTSGPRARQAIGYDRVNKRLYLYDSLTSAWRYAEFNNGVVPYAQITGAPAAITATTGDVVANGPGSVPATIQPGVVTNAKLANMTAPAFKGRITAGSGPPEDLTATQATSMLNQFTASLQGLVPASGGGSTNVLHADGTWSSAGGGGTVTAVTATDPATSTPSGSTYDIGVKFDNVTVVLNGGGGLRRAAIGGDGTIALGSNTFALTNIPTGTTMAGSMLATAIAAPGTPAAGKGSVYVDSTSKNFAVKDDAGVVKHGVQTVAAVSHQFAMAISDAGVVTLSQPVYADISGAPADISGLHYLTDRAEASLTNEINLGAQASSGVQQTVISGGVATFNTFAAGAARLPYGSGTAGGLTDSATLQFNGQTFGLGAALQEVQLYNASTSTSALAGFRTGTDAGFANSFVFEMPGTNWSGGALAPNVGLVELAAGSAPMIVSNFGTGKISFTTGASRTERVAFLAGGNVTMGSGFLYDEANLRLSVGATSGTDPGVTAQFTNNTNGIARIYVSNNSAGGSAFAGFVAGQSQTNSGTTPTVAMYMGGSSNSNIFYGANTGVFELYGGSSTGGNGNMIFSIVESTGGYLWKTGLTPANKMQLSNAGVLTVNGLGTGLAKTVAGAFANASASDVAAAIAWPAADRVLVSSGTSTAPTSAAGFAYDTSSDVLALSNGSQFAQFNVGTSGATNYEAVAADYSSNVWRLRSVKGGTGTVRSMLIDAGTATLTLAGSTVTADAGAASVSATGTGVLVGSNPSMVSSALLSYGGLSVLTSATLTGGASITNTAGFNGTEFLRPTYVSATATNIVHAATVAIKGPPVASGGLSITFDYPLWIQSGTVRIDSTLQPGNGGGPGVTLGSTGGFGPSTSAQAKWLPINSGGTVYWIPAFQ